MISTNRKRRKERNRIELEIYEKQKRRTLRCLH
jgi:hypothetical protein